MILSKKENQGKLDDLIKRLAELQDSDLEYILRTMERLDFDRIRRIANWLTHRRDGQ
jgi:hypothetical protein